MRIIKNNYNAHTEYERDCPRCGFSIPLNSEKVDDEETPTINTVQYPQDFYSYADSVKVKDSETNEWIKKCVSDLDKDTDYSFMASGDTIVFAFKSDEDVPSATVVVAKKYQEADVKISRKNF